MRGQDLPEWANSISFFGESRHHEPECQGLGMILCFTVEFSFGT